jgi:chromosome partitioning protein
MKVVTILNEKGGCGKTTLSGNLAAGLARQGYNVVLIDADPQYDLTVSVGLSHASNFYDLVVRKAEWQQVIKAVPESFYLDDTVKNPGRLFIVPGNVETEGISGRIQNTPDIIMKRVKQLANTIDYVIFDTSPTPSPLHPSIVLASDFILSPTDCARFGALNGLPNSMAHTDDFYQSALQYGYKAGRIVGVIPNKYRRTVIHDQILDHLKKEYGKLVYPPLYQYIAYEDAQLRNMSIFTYAPESDAAKQMGNIVKKVEGLEVVA